MAETMTGSSGEGKERKSPRVIWFIVGALVLCCVCGGGGALAWYLWNNGDRLLQGVGALTTIAAFV
jgi:hypothetical protein